MDISTKRKLLLLVSALIALTGCHAQSAALPTSEKLSSDKVAEIAHTINDKYPHLAEELRGRLLAMVVQSLDNMIFVEGGEFEMGDFGWPYDDDPADLCKWPCGVDPERMGNISMFGNDDFVHPVKLSSYHLSKYQATLSDLDLFFEARKLPQFDAEYRKREHLKSMYQPKLPAPAQSWQEAKDLCNWLGELSGYPVDLPTEAQWEYAARSRGQYVMFPTDNGNLNYGRNFPHPDERKTFDVDRFVPNPLGFYNLAGNATDWVNDWFGEDYYRKSPFENPQGPESGTQKIHRGSDVSEGPLLSATTVRRWADNPVMKGHYQGYSFRCAIQSHKSL